MCYYTLWLSPKHYVSPFVGRLAWTVNWCECSTWRSISSFLLSLSKFLKLPKTISSIENPAHLIYKSYTSHLRLTKSFSTWSYFKLLGMNIVKYSFLWKINVSVVTVQSERHLLNLNFFLSTNAKKTNNNNFTTRDSNPYTILFDGIKYDNALNATRNTMSNFCGILTEISQPDVDLGCVLTNRKWSQAQLPQLEVCLKWLTGRNVSRPCHPPPTPDTRPTVTHFLLWLPDFYSSSSSVTVSVITEWVSCTLCISVTTVSVLFFKHPRAAFNEF